MINRTFTQLGRGYSTVPVEIIARINDITVYEGEVDTVDQPAVASECVAKPLFTWHRPVEQTNIMRVEIRVFFGELILHDTKANHVWCAEIDGSLHTGHPPWPGGEQYFAAPNQFQISPSTCARDPFSNVKIDGIARDKNYTDYMLSRPMIGQWRWVIPDGSVWTAEMETNLAVHAAPWDPARSYLPRQFVSWNGCVYDTWTQVPAGTPPGDAYYWFPVPVQPWRSDLNYSKYQRCWHQRQSWVALDTIPQGNEPGVSESWENEWPNWNAFK